MKILGIDPGSRKTGWALIEVQGNKMKYLLSGVLRFEEYDFFLDRLSHIYKALKDLSKTYQPEEIAFESLIYVKSIESLTKLAEARGAMIAAVYEDCHGKVFEYSPNLIKSSVCGHGHATKEAIDKTMQLMYGKIQFKTSDESDALAIATCHALNRRAMRSRGVNL